MKYTKGLAREEFLQHMYEEFPSVFDTSFSREMLENIVDYGRANHTVTKNGLYYYLKAMIPQVEPKEIIDYLDKDMLTNEVLCLVEGQDLSVDELISNATQSCEELNKDVVDENTLEFIKE